MSAPRPPLQKILYVTAECPFPAIGGHRLRDASLIGMLVQHAPVEVLCFSADPHAIALPERVSLRQIERPSPSLWSRGLQRARATATFAPRSVEGYSVPMAHAIEQRGGRGTLVWLSRLTMAPYLPIARATGARTVLDEHSVEGHVLLERATASLRELRGLWQGWQTHLYERRACAGADAVVATSEIDAAKLRRLAPDQSVFVIPNAVDAEPFESLVARPGQSIFFSGTLAAGPNVEGLEWFAWKVLPRLRSRMKESLPRLVVAGADPSPGLVKTLTEAGIEVHPNPPSMVPLLADAAVVIAPLRSGSGTRRKILEAMAAGRAVVSTGKGAEGLILSPTWDIWIADSPDHFASAIFKLLTDPERRQQMGTRAAETVREHYDWRRVSRKTGDVVGALFELPANP